jgi:hypothetical protein
MENDKWKILFPQRRKALPRFLRLFFAPLRLCGRALLVEQSQLASSLGLALLSSLRLAIVGSLPKNIATKLSPLRSHVAENDVLVYENTVSDREIAVQVQVIVIGQLSSGFYGFTIDFYSYSPRIF